MEKERERIRFQEVRCPFCHEEIARGHEPIACPTCHAAHHGECFAEASGQCSACRAQHPRYAQQAVERTGAEEGVATLSRGAWVLSLGLLALTVVISLAQALERWRHDDARIYGCALIAAAVLASLMTRFALPLRFRTVRRLWGFFCALFGVGLLIAPTISEHISQHHDEASFIFGGILLALGGALLYLGGQRPPELEEQPETCPPAKESN